MPRRYAQYIPEGPTADRIRLVTRLAFHAVYGAMLGAGLGEILRSASRRWGAK